MDGNTLLKKIFRLSIKAMNNLGVKIKPAAYVDHKKILKLERQLFYKEAVSSYNLMYYPTFIMSKWGKYIGHYIFFVNNNECYLYSLAIDKLYENHDYIDRLIRHCLTLNKHKNCITHVPETNKKLINVLEAHGFKMIRIDKKYYNNGDSAIYMCKINERKYNG